MRSWPIRPETLLRVTLALVTTAFPLLAIAIGAAELLSWIHVYRGNQYYYVEYWSLKDVGWWLLMGMIGVLPTGWILFQPQASLRWLWLPMLVSLFIFMYPAVSSPPDQRARNQVRQQLTHFAFEMRHAAEQDKPWHCTSGPTTTLSPYSQAGERLFYQRLCVGADRPTASLLASSAPGTIYIATGPDEKVVWLIATVLHGNASDTVRWLRVSSGEPLVLAGELSLSGMDHRLAD